MGSASSPPVHASHGDTALHLAARHGCAKALTVLLQATASLEVPDSQGNTPLMHACQAPSPEIVRLLLGARADPFRDSGDGYTAFQELLVEMPISQSISLLEDCLDSLLITKTDQWKRTQQVYFRSLDALRASGALELIVERYQA